MFFFTLQSVNFVDFLETPQSYRIVSVVAVVVLKDRSLGTTTTTRIRLVVLHDDRGRVLLLLTGAGTNALTP